MQMTKKITSIVLAVLMVVSMMAVMAVSVSAATAQVVSEDDPNANVMYTNTAGTSVKYYTQFPTLSAGTYKVLKDFTQTIRAATGTFGATYTIDLNKKTVTFDIEEDGFGFAISHRGGTATITNGGKMICADNADDDRVFNLAGGTLNIESSVTVEGAGDVTPVVITKGTLNTAGKLYATDSFAIATNGADSKNFTINVTGGTVKSTNAAAIYQPADGTLNISGGTIEGKTGVYVKSGELNITGGTIKGTGDAADYDYNGNGCNSTGDALVVDSCGYPGGAPEVNVNGGTFNSKNGDAIASYKKSDDAEFATDTTPAVTGFVKQATLSKGTADADLYDADLYDIDTQANTATPKTLTDEITWEWVESTNVNYREQAKMTVTVGGEVYYTTTVNPTVAIVNGNDFKYTATAKYAGITYTAPEKVFDANGVIMATNEFNQAVAAGGEWELGNDLNNVPFKTVPNGFKLDGKNHTIYANTSVMNQNYLFTAKDANTKFELSNVTLDGNNKRYGAVSAYTGNGGNNPGNVITLNNVTIQNFKSSYYTGAVYAFGTSTVNLNNCTVTGNKNNTNAQKVNGNQVSADAAAANSGKDIWAGAAATVNINGGTIGEVLLHGGTANTTVEGGATVDTVRFGYTNSVNEAKTAKAVINDATVNELSSCTDFTEANVVKDDALATVGAPDGYKWVDSAEAGKKVLELDNPLENAYVPAITAADAVAQDQNVFDLPAGLAYTEGEILGVQKKSDITTDIGFDGLRFIAEISKNQIDTADEYGFVLARVAGDKKTAAVADSFASKMKVGAAGCKTFKCNGTDNNVCGNEAYGDPTTDTPYKYVTCAVYQIPDGYSVAARFYVKKGDNYYYAKYTTNGIKYNGICSPKNPS